MSQNVLVGDEVTFSYYGHSPEQLSHVLNISLVSNILVTKDYGHMCYE